MENATAELMAGQGSSKEREHYVTMHPRADRDHLCASSKPCCSPRASR